MNKTFSYNVILFLLTHHAFRITIHTLAFFVVLAVIAFVFIAHAYFTIGAPLITATISVAIVVGTAAIVAFVRSCTD